MGKLQILGAFLIIIGASLILGSTYISSKVGEGRKKIELSKPPTSPGEEQIKEGTKKAEFYANLANGLKFTGITLTALGFIIDIFVLLFGFFKKH